MQDGFVIVTFKRVNHVASNNDNTNLSPTYHQLVTNLSDQVKVLIMCLEDKVVSVPELQNTINSSPKSRRLFKEQYINPALEQELIEMTHPESSRHPQQKYRLTRKGNQIKSIINK